MMATGSAAPTTAVSEMTRRWCVKKDVVAMRKERLRPCMHPSTRDSVWEVKTDRHSAAAHMRARLVFSDSTGFQHRCRHSVDLFAVTTFFERTFLFRKLRVRDDVGR
jgi:hypothetical protein